MVLVAGISFIILYPLIAKLCLSFMAERDLYDPTIRFVAKNFTLENYKLALEQLKYFESILNTFVISFFSSFLQLIACTLVGYGFARFEFPFKKLLFGIVLLTLIVPPQALMLPTYLHFRHFDIFGIFKLIMGEPLKFLDSYIPFFLLSATTLGLKNGLYIYIIIQFFRGLPKELEEAALVDGAGMFKTFYRIMLPNAVPIMMTVFLFSFVWQWNDSFYTSLFLTNMPVLSISLGSLADNVQQFREWQVGTVVTLSPSYISMMNNTGSLLVIAPLLIVYGFAQRYFVEGIERSGIVG